MAGKKDIVEQALKLIAGGVKEAGPSAAERAAQNLDVFNTAKRLGEDTNDIAKLQETKRLIDYHKGLMGDVKERVKALAEIQRQMREQGAFPMEVGTRYTTEQTRRLGQPPYVVQGYYINPKDPYNSYGYRYRQEYPNGDFSEGHAMIRDPKLEKLHGPEKWEEIQKGIIPMTGPKVVKNSGGRAGYGPGGVIDDIVKMAGKIVSGADEPAKTGIRAYQGSPHDFAAERLVRFPDKTEQYIVGTPDVLPDVPEGAEVIQDFPLGRMRMDKIGTGEGAQAYGHGLYAAEAEDVAQGYRQRLANVDASEADKIGIPPNYWNAFTMFAKQADETQAEAAARDFANWTGLGFTPDLVRAFDNTLKSRGRMYEVNINADPNQFLDWDKPLSEQPEAVKNMLARLPGAPDQSVWPYTTGNDLYEQLRVDAMGDDAFMQATPQRLAARKAAAPEVTKVLGEAGIPGIKYLDAGSRRAGEGTRNYVVFDEKLISIIRKYGIAGASAMLGYNLMDGLDSKQALAATMADQDYQNAAKDDGERIAKGGGGRALEEALRIAREGIEGLSRSEGKTPQELLGGFANQKPRVPFEEWRYEFEPTADLLQSKEFSPESLRPGDVIIPLIGDRTSTGRKITSIAGQPLETPAITEGGPDYMRGPSQQADKSVWASGKGVISQLEGRIQNALRASEAKGYKDPSVYGSYVAMGPQSGDFSTHTAEAVMGMLPGSKIKRADVKEFDAKMRERFADWPGIKSPKAADYVINANAGEHRKAFLDVMDSAYWRDKGFPDVSLARYATTTPELVSAPTEAAGYNIARITPSQKPELITQIHRSYPSTMHGEYVGGLPAGMTRDELFTQFSRGFDADPPARNYVMAKRRSFGMDPNAFQVMDEPEIQALIDKVERIKQGYEQGGEVYEDDDINDALRIAKDNGGSTGSVFMTDAKGINYDINGNIIPPEVTGPNPARSEATPEQVGQRAAQDPATFDALMQKYAVPDQDIARYEATKAAVAKQPYETQQMTHVGAPPMRDVKVDMPLLGGEKKITQAPYNVAGPMSMAAQTAYDLKTVPLYFTPFTAPIGAGLDVGEGVATGDPLQASLAALGAPGKYAKAAIIGGSNYLMSPAEAQAGPARWFSRAMEVARDIPMNKMTGEQALAMLRKGTSPEELKWTGTDVFLQGKPQVTKQELVDYLNNNRVQTTDVVLGGSKPFRRDDVVPSETAIASMKQRWDELAAKKREINQQVMLAPSERRANYDQLMEEQIAIDDEMDKLHGKMIDDTIAEMVGLAVPPKFQTYSTPGGQNYEETLITLPKLPGTEPVEYQVFGAFPQTFKTRAEAEKHVENINNLVREFPSVGIDRNIKKYPLRIEEIYEKPEFWEGHWDRPDVIAHVRSQILDATTPGANRPYKAWSAEEFQSKWGQEGRDQGFAKEIDPNVARELDEKRLDFMFRHERERENFINVYEAIQDEKIKNAYKDAPTQWDLPNALKQAQDARRKPHEAKFRDYKSNFLRQQNEFTPEQFSALQHAYDAEFAAREAYNEAFNAARDYKSTNGISRAPYVTSTEGWTDLALKKSLDKAIDSGSDYFTWTPGEIQAQRYNLGNYVSELHRSGSDLVGFDKTGKQVFRKTGITKEELPKYVGKELAQKLENAPVEDGWKSVTDLDEMVGGQGMIEYYNKIVPRRLIEVIRKATGKKPKIETITVQTANGPRQQLAIRIDDDIRNARFSDFNKGGRVTGGNTYDNDSSVANALALTSEY